MNSLSKDELVLDVLVDEIDRYLATLAAPGVIEVRERIASWRSDTFQAIPPHHHDALRHLAPAFADMDQRGRGDLARAIRRAAPLLHWIPYDSYPRDLIGARFADDHAFGSIAVHRAGDNAPDFDFGLFVIGPDLLYRDHNHAAPELYAPLTGPHGFRFASGEPLSWIAADEPVWNAPFRQHAIKTGALPFLCVYAWTADVNEPAQVIVEPDWPVLEASKAP